MTNQKMGKRRRGYQQLRIPSDGDHRSDAMAIAIPN
jgi:hypothetical protein